jgi:sugar phosphate isomerase/epimerase
MWFAWQQDLEALLNWCGENRIGVIDLGGDAEKNGGLVLKRGMRLGSVDLPEWAGLLSPDAAKRKASVAKCVAHIEACAKFGPMNHFTVMLPEKAELPRQENFGYMVESYKQLAPALTAAKAKIVIEGWPGPGALCCTPETYGRFFQECSAPVFGINYDPSHLIRMGIDPLRFLREFSGRVYHVHGKDTELFAEQLYQYGSEQPATFGKPRDCGSMHWRYSIPGHGVAPWTEIFKVLVAAKYQGAVCVELEDDNFMGSEQGEKNGTLFARDILESF